MLKTMTGFSLMRSSAFVFALDMMADDGAVAVEKSLCRKDMDCGRFVGGK